MGLDVVIIILFGLSVLLASVYMINGEGANRDAIFKAFCLAVLAILVCFVMIKVSGTTATDVLDLFRSYATISDKIG